MTLETAGPLRAGRDGPKVRITLTRPDRRNALDAELIAALTAAFSDVGDARAVVLSGEGDSFCAGGRVNTTFRAINVRSLGIRLSSTRWTGKTTKWPRSSRFSPAPESCRRNWEPHGRPKESFRGVPSFSPPRGLVLALLSDPRYHLVSS